MKINNRRLFLFGSITALFVMGVFLASFFLPQISLTIILGNSKAFIISLGKSGELAQISRGVRLKTYSKKPTPTPTSSATPLPTNDTIRPLVNSFGIQPTIVTDGKAITSSFAVSDLGGSHLKMVGLNRAAYSSLGCNESNKKGCAWLRVAYIMAPANLDSWVATLNDLPSKGTWWYGLEVIDGAGLSGYEPSPIKVVVNPVTSSPTPTPTPTLKISPTPTPIPSTQTTVSDQFGMSVGQSLLSLSTTELNLRLDEMVVLGIDYIRFDIDWSNIQPSNATTFSWSTIDRLVTAANLRGIKLLPILDGTPVWARPPGCSSNWCPPADNTAFAAFAATAVQRYSSQGVHVWEVWNEPNLKGFWRTGGSALDYTNLLRVTYSAIKQKDPSAFVVSGGTGPAATINGDVAPIDFLNQMYQYGAKGYFDAVGFHPYSYPARPTYLAQWNAWSQMGEASSNLRNVMIINGDSAKPIWMTEFGAPTGGPGALSTTTDYNFSASPDHVTEDLQSLIISDAITLVRGYAWAGPLFFYSYKDLGVSTTTIENFFGVLRYDGSRKPAYDTIKQMLVQ